MRHHYLADLASSGNDCLRMNASGFGKASSSHNGMQASKSAGQGAVQPIWKSAIRQAWKPALLCAFGVGLALTAGGVAQAEQTVDLAGATLVIRAGQLPKAEQAAAQVLVEELEKRTGKRLPVSTAWPKDGLVVAVTSGPADAMWGHAVPKREGGERPEMRPEGYRVVVEGGKVVWVVGADPRGALFGVGRLLRTMEWARGTAKVSASLDVAAAPAYAIRGHQLGYRNRANSYDGWDKKQYEQYIRELVIFGANSVENIPFEDTQKSPHMPVPRTVMNRQMSEICDRYDVDYWVWTPVVFDLSDQKLRAEELQTHEAFYRDCPRLNGIFFPGADPGKNSPELVLPFLEDLAKLLAKYHPEGRVWVSMQGFNGPKLDYVVKYLEEQKPAWLGGIVAGPQSLSTSELRARIPKAYPVRDYPDITHTVRCQYPVTWWDPAFNFTLGRECCNPRPLFYTYVHQHTAPGTAGFISYSDGCHDDVNKVIWNLLSVDPKADPRETLIEYARFFFGPDVAETAADGIMAFEKNWEGPLVTNPGVNSTLAVWEQLEKLKPELKDNWRWQMCLLRANYDAYIRHRQMHETRLEEEANDILAQAGTRGGEAAMDAALAVLKRAETEPCRKDLRGRVDQLCQALFDSIRLQTSVKRFQASETERGCVLDFVDYPLNNRWWLEDQFAQVRKMATEQAKVARLEALARWEHPGPGSCYDALGDQGKSPHLVRGPELNTDPLVPLRGTSIPGFVWDQGGYSRLRLTWQSGLRPAQMVYENLDPNGQYTIRINGKDQESLYVNQTKVEPAPDTKEQSEQTKAAAATGAHARVIPEFTNFPIPQALLKDRRIVVGWHDPAQPPRPTALRFSPLVAEVWLLKK